jgi:cation diffusion facilitator family transporter
MTNLIKRLFIKDYKNTADSSVRARYGTVAGAVGIITNLLLAAVKIAIGAIFGAIAIIADGVNNFTDSLSSVITLVGFKLSDQQADEEHPYGHGRMEYIAAMLISMVMVMVGFTLVQESFPKIFAPEKSEFSWLLMITLLLSIAFKLWQGLFYRAMGKAIESNTLYANFRDSFNDVFSTAAILISVLISPLIGYNTDGLMGTAVALIIMWSGVMLMKDTIQPLLGEGADAELAAKIEELVMAYDGIEGIHDLVVHNYGPGRMFASLHAEVPAEVDVLVSHDLIDNIERELKKSLGLQLSIHMDPIVTTDPKLDELRLELAEILKEYSPVTYHDLRLVRGTTHHNVLFDLVVPFKYELSDDDLCRRVSKAVQERHPDYYAVISVDKDMIRK